MDDKEFQKLKAIEERKEMIISMIFSGVIAFILGAFVFVLYFFLMGHRFIDAVNGAALSTIILFSYAILSILARLGAFDTFAYGFIQLGHAMFSKNPRKYANMADYKQAKYDQRKTKNKTYIATLIVSSLFLIALIVLEIIYHSKIGG